MRKPKISFSSLKKCSDAWTDPFAPPLPEFTNEGQAFVEFKGSAAEPIILRAQPIDWLYNIGIQISDPLNPTVAFSGGHDGFPSYEVYINANHHLFPETDVFQFTPPKSKGVLELFGGATELTGGFTKEIDQSLAP